ncbi:MAG TPA: AgmX/PglI C-terminal domain-containing protein [Polyangiaceae bacterium]|nr:AgmX/PglI C-terminal domain-containing protein [Polyangiaceae bacterium]
MRTALGAIVGATVALPLVFAGPARADTDAGLVSPTAGPAGGRILAEPVYACGQRTRADGPVQASAADEELARWNVGGDSAPGYVSNKPGFHVAPRVKVDVLLRPGQLPLRSSVKGALSETAVLAQSRNHGYWPFRICYEASLRKDPKLRGKSRMHAIIERSGQVRGGRVVDSELADRDVARCLAARAEQLRFSPPPSRRLGFDLVVELSPGDAPLPRLALDEPETTSVTPAPPLDTRRVGELLSGSLDAAGACYLPAWTSDPGLWGRLGFRVDVDRHGNVTVKEYESRFPDPGVVRCVQSAVEALPIASTINGPARFTWGLRFGSPPQPAPAPIPPKNDLSTSAAHSTVAESPAPRLPMAR